MMRRSRQPKPVIIQVLVLGTALLFLLGLYVLAMRLSLDTSRLKQGDRGDRRDEIYLGIHLGLALFAGVVGAALGKWLNGLGFAVMVLFVVVLLVAMLFALMASQSLACSGGHNDLIRHWKC